MIGTAIKKGERGVTDKFNSIQNEIGTHNYMLKMCIPQFITGNPPDTEQKLSSAAFNIYTQLRDAV